MKFRLLSLFFSVFVIVGCKTSTKENLQEHDLRTITLTAKDDVFVTVRKESDRTSLLHEVLKKEDIREIDTREPVIIYTTKIENLQVSIGDTHIFHSPSYGVVEFTLK